MMKRSLHRSLRAQIASGIVVPGCYDALTALLIAEAGFESAYLSGASIAYTRFGRPDIGLVSMSEVADVVGQIRERLELPIIVDADNGYGNALNVYRTVRLFEARGASALQLEDQSMPKRCGHLTEKSLIGADEMVGKIKAAVDARRSEETLIIARTDAIGVQGFDNALERAEHYVAAGADLLFIEAPNSQRELVEIGRRFSQRIPLVANMVEGGVTPILSASELQAAGFSLILFPGGTVRALINALQAYFASLKDNGTTMPYRDRMLDLKGVNDIVGTSQLLELGSRYR